MKSLDLNEFKNPSSKYRSIPFWAWNDKLDTEEIKRQIREMHKSGMGGFFMHSRDGLETEYLSEEWFNCIKAAVNEAKANSMHAWLYDEDRWPSGTCGGSVTKGEGKGCKGLTLEVCETAEHSENVLALYAAQISDMEICSLRRITASAHINEGEKVLAVRLEISEGSEWFNFSPPPDNLSCDEVGEFIKSTHEKYKENAGEEFGRTIRGIFTDEPSLADRHAAFNPNRGWIPWTDGFEEYYQNKRGRDVFETLPYIYFNHEKSFKARHDYWRTISERFLEAYSLQISEWCKENNIAYTGHFLQEDKLGLSCRVNGSIMPHYALEETPAIDMLTDRTTEYMTVKQCTSVANQLGKDMVLSEMYGCTGWDFSFEGQKHIGEWQYVLGINQRCQHLALYSLRGCRKRDYPPSINSNAPWWKQYKTVEDYFARLGYVLRRGRRLENVLVIHPMSTVWSHIGCNPYGNPVRKNERDVPEMNKLGDRLNSLIKELCHRHYGCELGDETIISNHGSTENGKINIGRCSYNTVIIPFCETLLPSTIEFLIEFMNQGGNVISIAPHTQYAEGENSEVIQKLTMHPKYNAVNSEDELYAYMPKPLVSLTDDSGNEIRDILYQLRKDSDGYILYIVNTSEKPHKVNVDFSGYKLNLMNGQIYRFNASAEYIPPYGSSLFYITDKEFKCDEDKQMPTDMVEIPLRLTGYNTSAKNILTLDKCRYTLDFQKSDLLEVWQAQWKVRESLGMRQINLNGIEQRYRWINKPYENDGKEIVLEFPFTSLCEVDDAELVIERPHDFEIKLDGESVSNVAYGYFYDKSFERIPLPIIKSGEHVLTLRCRYRNDFELENCYITGTFGVNTSREITDKPQTIKLGDITTQGFFHYAGAVEYNFECDINSEKGIYLDAGDFKGICACVNVNGKEISIPWRAAGMVNMDKLLNHGHNKITVKVYNGLGNMLGPLHLKDKPLVTKDSSFCPTGDNHTEEYIVSQTGLYSIKLYCK